MKDRFKFRAFSRKWGMIYPDTEGYSINVHSNSVWMDLCVDECPTLMQCTGLKDRNGELIWEGDVIRSIYWHQLVESCEVYYHQDSAHWLAEHSTGNRSLDRIECGQVYEVIGNIYENPDLLT